ncbi:MAG: hypothetical protein R2831_05910 [Chitinophagaceae bacterium]
MEKNKFQDTLAIYNKIIAKITLFEVKGKSMPYTSSNGHMFSQVNKNGELGIRLSKSDRESFYKEYNDDPFLSYGAIMKEYVKIPNELLKHPIIIKKYLLLGFDYVNTLKTK